MPSILSYFNPLSKQHQAVAEFVCMESHKEQVMTCAIAALGAIATLPLAGIGGIAAFRWAAHHYAPKSDRETAESISLLNLFVEQVDPRLIFQQMKENFLSLSRIQKTLVIVSSIALTIFSLPVFGILGPIGFGVLSKTLKKYNVRPLPFRSPLEGKAIEHFEKYTKNAALQLDDRDTFFEQTEALGFSKAKLKKWATEHPDAYNKAFREAFKDDKDFFPGYSANIWDSNTQKNASKIRGNLILLQQIQFQQKIDHIRIALLQGCAESQVTVHSLKETYGPEFYLRPPESPPVEEEPTFEEKTLLVGLSGKTDLKVLTGSIHIRDRGTVYIIYVHPIISKKVATTSPTS